MALVTQIYISYYFIYAPWGLMGHVLLAQEKFKPIVILYSVIGILNLIISLLLVKPYGLKGVVLGTTIPYFLIMPILIPYGAKLLRLNLKKYLRYVMYPAYPLALLTAFLVFAIQYIFPDIFDNLVMFIGLAALAAVTYFGSFYLIGLSRKEKREVMGYLGR